MSMQSWKEEFYPVPATEAVSSELEAVLHCLRKWKGLEIKNVEKHNLNIYHNGDLWDDNGKVTIPTFMVDDTTCALCQMNTNCDQCIVKVFDVDCNASDSAWREYHEHQKPNRMIKILRTCKKYLELHGEQF